MMLPFAIATLRHRKGSFIGALIALFAAAALITGCGTLLVTGILGSVKPERFAAAPIVVTGDQNVHAVEIEDKGRVRKKAKPVSDHVWVSADLADQIKALPSVKSVATEVLFAAYLPGGPTSDSFGHGWESASLSGLKLGSGRAPTASDEVVLDASTAAKTNLHVGSTVPLRTASGTMPVHVVGVTSQGFASQAAIYFDTAEARHLAGHDGQVDAIGVFPAVDTGSTEKDVKALISSASVGVVPAPVVHTGDARGAAEFPDSANASVRLISMGAVLGGTAVIVAVLVVVGTFVLSIQQRQREIAVLRAVAATGKQVRKMIGGEALAVGAVAGAAGAVAGLPLGAWLHNEFVSLGIIPANVPVVLSVFPVLASLLATVAAGWAAARISARRATRIRPVEALGEAELKPPRMSAIRVLFGLLAVAGATVLTVLLTILHSDGASQPVSLNAVLLWCIALALLGPWVARAAAAVLGVPLRWSRVGGYLAANNLRAAAPRLASVVTPLTLMTAMACAILFSQTSVANAATAQRAAGNIADYVVGSKVPADAAAEVKAVPGVTTLTQVLHATVRTGLNDRNVLGATPAGLADTLDLGVTSGSLAQFTGPSTAAAASGQGYHVGSQVSMTLPDGTPTQVTIVALYSRQLGFGDLVLAHDLLASHVDVPLDDELLVKAPGVPRAALVAALKAEAGLGIKDRVAAQASNDDASNKFGYVTLALIVAFTAIAMVNTLAMSISDRGREFAALRLTGATRRQIQRMLGWETAVAVLVATGLALAVTVAVLTTYTSGMTRGTAGVSMPPGMLAAVLGGGAVLAGVATWVPARAALAAGARQG
ncbi:ABC transporter permease [Catenulispora pinisilvae]|uniref:ABC transporter permease n=1 Tax=Catenulispora pinisilvae TaxID=2705253 RepID=UPI001E35C2BC|nr:FtsX-like permease family protein [Catenulispora pinisilvae]